MTTLRRSPVSEGDRPSSRSSSLSEASSVPSSTIDASLYDDMSLSDDALPSQVGANEEEADTQPDILPNQPRQRRRKTNRRCRTPRTAEEKLSQVVDLLKSFGWTFQQLINQWIGTSHASAVAVLKHRQYRTVQLRRRALLHTLSDDSFRQTLDNGPINLYDTLVTEFKILTNWHPFAAHDIAIDFAQFDVLAAAQMIEDHAPTWYTLLLRLSQHERFGQTSYESRGRDPELRRRIFFITSVICHTRARKRSNHFTKALGFYLTTNGVKRSVIAVLNGLGVCDGYKAVNSHVNALSQSAKVNTRFLNVSPFRRTDRLAQAALPAYSLHPQNVLCYDNLNVNATVRDEALGSTSKMISMTNAILVRCPELPPEGLTQSMHNPSIPLSLTEYFDCPAISGNDGGIGVEISTALIFEAISFVYSKSIHQTFPRAGAFARPRMPIVDRLPVRKTEFRQLDAIFCNEGTLSGTYDVHNDIFLNQLDMRDQIESDLFTQRLWPTHGDQMTVHHLRSVQHESASVSRAYDQRRFLLGPTALFHTMMNLLFTIVRSHWSTADGQWSRHTLEADVVHLNRKQVTRGNLQYHLLEPIVYQSYAARILAVFHDRLLVRLSTDWHDQHNNNGQASPDFWERALQAAGPQVILAAVEDVRQALFTKQAWDGQAPLSADGTYAQHGDANYTTMCRFVQEAEMFLTLKHAVKYADIGLLRRLYDQLPIVFYGSGQNNYGAEMLHWKWLLSPGVCTEALQRALLSSSLVNMSGRNGNFKPIDLLLEHLNSYCKNDMKRAGNSTHDIEKAFQRVAVISSISADIRSAMERNFGEQMSGRHSRKDTRGDVFNLACALADHGVSHPLVSGSDGASPAAAFLSSDILREGADTLEQRIESFNARVVRPVSGTMVLQASEMLDAVDAQFPGTSDFVDIETVAPMVNDELDIVDISAVES